MEMFHGRCIRCGTDHNVSIHEIDPRVTGKSAMRLENRVPLCIVCHDWAHHRGTSYSKPDLLRLREEALKRYA